MLIDKNNKIDIKHNIPTSSFTWFGSGGHSKYYFRPKDIETLIYFLNNNNHHKNMYILGAGSNLLIRDLGYDGLLIHLLDLNKIELDNSGNIIAECGALDAQVSRFARNNSRTGLEFLIGIPGSIGGGIKMNSGAYGNDFENILIDVKAINKKGKLKTFKKNELGLGYRKNKLNDDWIFLSARFKTSQNDRDKIQNKMKEIINNRKISQPTGFKTGGSTFMNGKNFKAWELIDKAGCRGLKFGGAQISSKHCNFIINNKNASSFDIESLGEDVRKKVMDKTGIKLNWEIKILGKK